MKDKQLAVGTRVELLVTIEDDIYNRIAGETGVITESSYTALTSGHFSEDDDFLIEVLMDDGEYLPVNAEEIRAIADESK